ncbi:MAG: trypsin-like serine protease [Bacteroidales bacterium]|nr:trypsin-like serine protease [Bacteroidales bacterium]
MRTYRRILFSLLVLAIYICCTNAYAQPEMGGTPRSVSSGLSLGKRSVYSIPGPDLKLIQTEDNKDAGLEKPYRVGISIPVDIEIQQIGEWYVLPDGGKLWIFEITVEGAIALGLDFDRFLIPETADFFVSNIEYSHIAGAFTDENQNEDGTFTVRPVRGNQLRLEYYQPENCNEIPEIHIGSLNFIYRGFELESEYSSKGFGGSDDCEVNVLCDEGSQWLDQANGVVRILTRVSGQSFWCTGSILNNTAFDFSPLLLTANHCARNMGAFASASDMNKWVFYFKYQSATCANPVSEPAEKSMTGAERLASSQNPLEIGSDFYLVRLKQPIPSAYNAYYNGWNRDVLAATSGVGIHHPQGDIKKISTYNKELSSGTWQSIPNTHWIVEWVSTSNGYGVTEAGSSGSPLFDENGLLIGTLTGGESACSYTSGKDYYGKVAFSWNSNGSVDSLRMEPWLDPLQEGRLTVEGAYNNLMVVADFKADTTAVVVGGTLDFFDLSLRNPTSWKWDFEGGNPSQSFEANPMGIKYDTCGKFKVKLTVSNQYGQDTLVKLGYIDVKSILYPNPTSGKVTIFTNSRTTEQALIRIYDALGRFQSEIVWESNAGPAISFDLPRSGKLFFIQMIQGDMNQIHKVIVLQPGAD